MNENVIKKIRNDFDCIALNENQGWNHNKHYHRFLLKQLPLHCKTILDIGCGTGEFSRLLAQRTDKEGGSEGERERGRGNWMGF